MSIEKGKSDNGQNCGIYLELCDGPFPCRVSYTIKVVHYDGKTESAYVKKATTIYTESEGSGYPDFIPLSKLTDADSPYVKDGEVTFIITFRILPSDYRGCL